MKFEEKLYKLGTPLWLENLVPGDMVYLAKTVAPQKHMNLEGDIDKLRVFATFGPMYALVTCRFEALMIGEGPYGATQEKFGLLFSNGQHGYIPLELMSSYWYQKKMTDTNGSFFNDA